MCVNATRQDRCIRVQSTKRIRKEMSYLRPKVGRHSIRAKNLATLPVWRENPNFHRPREFKIFLHPGELNMRQRRWLKLVKDYNVDIKYHPGNVNMVADSLSRKTTHSSTLITMEVRIQRYCKRTNIAVVTEGVIAQLARLTVQPTLRQRIITSQREDPGLQKILSQLAESPVNGFSKSSDKGLLCQGRLCVSTIEELRKEILTKAHNLPFAMHTGDTMI